MRWAAVSLLFIVLLSGCAPEQKNPTGNEPTQPSLILAVEAQPWAVPADGTSQIVIFAECRENGQPVPDSTEIVFLNSIGTLKSGIVLTRAGVALDTLTADTSAALGHVIAYTLGVRDTVEVMFTEP